jgi:N-acetyl-anhydromuramyl-L-alanine amidase AmpD
MNLTPEFPCVTSVRPDGTGLPMTAVFWIVIHTAECAETSKSAENVASFLVSRQDASCHFVVDNDSTVQQRSVLRQAGAAPGSNENGIHIELSGFARQTAAEWSDAYSIAMLDRAAELVAALCSRFELPAEFVDVDGLKINARGVTTHAAVSKAFRRSNHVDPGKFFPMTDFLALVREKMARAAESIYDE